MKLDRRDERVDPADKLARQHGTPPDSLAIGALAARFDAVLFDPAFAHSRHAPQRSDSGP